MARTRTRSTRASGCAKMACGSGGMSTLAGEQAYALGGQTTKCPTATCPAYTGVVVFLLVLYLFYLSLNFSIRPKFMLKAGAHATDPNAVETTAGFLYALLWTALTLVAIALVVRCRSCA